MEKVKITSKICMVKDLGLNGNLFGGNMLAWVDEAASIFAHKTTGEPKMVTLKFEEIVFMRPVKQGDIIDFYCTNYEIGSKSITIQLMVCVETSVVFRTSCVFVAVDDEGHSKPIKGHDVENYRNVLARVQEANIVWIDTKIVKNRYGDIDSEETEYLGNYDIVYWNGELRVLILKTR